VFYVYFSTQHGISLTARRRNRHGKRTLLWACNRQFDFGPWICQLQYLIIYFGIRTGVEIYNVWLWKFWEI